jgi:hypothetical protein
MGGNRIVLLMGSASGQNVSAVLGQLAEDAGNLGRSLPLSENDFWHTNSKSAVVIDLRKSQVFKRQMAETLHRFVRRKLSIPYILENASERGGVHCSAIVKEARGQEPRR